MSAKRATRACVVDTIVLHRANQARLGQREEGDALRERRLLLVELIQQRRTLLISRRVVQQYRDHLVRPLNDVVRAFLEYATAPDPSQEVVVNWSPLTGTERDLALGKCRFPQHDLFLLQTAYGFASTILTEEPRLVRTDDCLHRRFGVHVRDPTA
jgi:hypothetical protein